MKTIVIRNKIRSNSINDVKDWFQSLRTRENEVLESMRNEGVIVESAFLDRHGDDVFLIYYLKAHSIEKAYEVFNSSTLEIDNFFKSNWDRYIEKGRVVLEELLDLDLI